MFVVIPSFFAVHATDLVEFDSHWLSWSCNCVRPDI